ncbi:MAG: hypothetical protein ACRDKX_03720, partial [Solirubrobacterales bacterium]
GGPSFQAPFGIARAPSGDLLVVDPSAFPDNRGGVIRVDGDTGERTTVSANGNPSGGPSFTNPVAIARAPNGDLLVVDFGEFGPGLPGDGGVIRVDPATGERTTVSENANPSGGPSFVDPIGIALAPNGDMFVVDEGAFGGGGGVIRVDRDTGERTTVSENANPGGGPSFVDPEGIARAPNGELLVTDASAGAVIRVDPATGARTTVSDNQDPSGAPSFAVPVGIVIEPGSLGQAP